MKSLRQASWSQRLMAVAMAAAIAFSARDAIAATTTFSKTDCEATNWCSGDDPQGNCRTCCQGDGLCYSYDQGIQGCLCL